MRILVTVIFTFFLFTSAFAQYQSFAEAHGANEINAGFVLNTVNDDENESVTSFALNFRYGRMVSSRLQAGGLATFTKTENANPNGALGAYYALYFPLAESQAVVSFIEGDVAHQFGGGAIERQDDALLTGLSIGLKAFVNRGAAITPKVFWNKFHSPSSTNWGLETGISLFF